MDNERSPAELIDSWVRRGVISPEQAAVMRADLAPASPAPGTSPPPGPRTSSVLVEALGWLGAVIVVIGLGLLIGTWWDDLAPWGRIVLVAAVAAALVGGGFALPATTGPSVRVRVALWLAGSLGAAFAAGLLAEELTGRSDERIGVVAALVSAAVSAALWRVGRHTVQHLATAVALGVGAMLLVGWLGPDRSAWLWPGLALAAVGTVWAGLSAVGVIHPDEVGIRIGAAMSIVGLLTTTGSDAGRVIAVIGVAAWVGAALWRSDLVLLGMAALGALIAVPVLVTDWFPGALPAAVALLVVGGLLVGAAVLVARRRREHPEPARASGS